MSENKRFLTPKICEIVLQGCINAENKPEEEKPAGPRLAPRQLEIIRLLAARKSNKELSAQLGITLRTVETHHSRIMLKLGLRSLADLIHYAMRNDILSAKHPD
jgi:DNA-binding NarL/FixJ family response regulator